MRSRPNRAILLKRQYIIDSQKIWLALAIISFQLAFWLYFRDCLSVLEGENLDYTNSATPIVFLIGALLIASFAWILPSHINSFYSNAVWILFIVLVLPSWVVIYSLNELPFSLTFLLVVIIPVAALATLNPTTKPTADCQAAGHPHTILLALLLLAAIIICLITNQVVIDFDLDAVYDRRAIFNSKSGSVGGYAVATLEHALTPIAIIFTLVNRKWHLIPLVVASCLVPFITSGSKFSLIVPILIIAAWFFISRAKSYFTPILITIALTLLVALAWIANNQDVNLYLGRRIFAVPTYLSIQYFKVFNSIQYLYGSDIPLLAELIHSRGRGESASMQVGAIITQQDIGLNASSSVFSNGFAEAGLLGAWLAGFLVFVLLGCFRSLLITTQPIIGILLALPISLVLTESALHTSILSSGILAIFVFAALLLRTAPRTSN